MASLAILPVRESANWRECAVAPLKCRRPAGRRTVAVPFLFFGSRFRKPKHWICLSHLHTDSVRGCSVVTGVRSAFSCSHLNPLLLKPPAEVSTGRAGSLVSEKAGAPTPEQGENRFAHIKHFLGYTLVRCRAQAAHLTSVWLVGRSSSLRSEEPDGLAEMPVDLFIFVETR